MGLKIGRFLKKQVGSIFKRAPGIIGGFVTGGPLAAGLAAIAPRGGGFVGGVGAGVPSIQDVTGVPAIFAQPVLQRNGGIAVPTAAGAVTPFAVVGMSRAVAMAITKLAVALGIPLTLAKLSRVGLRLWRSVNTLARRHPGISVLAFLTGLGLLADEAAEFLFWGQARARRRRGRGISARDIRICRRTIRKMSAFRRDLGGLGGGRRIARRRGRGDGTVVVAQQD